jgi:hypothetical protein
MTDSMRDDRGEPVEEVVRDTVDESHDETTRREAVEQELEERGRSDEGADVEVSEIVDADGVDPPEPSQRP